MALIGLFSAVLFANTQLFKEALPVHPSVRPYVRTYIRPSIRPSIRPLVLGHQVEKWEKERFRYFLRKFECWGAMGFRCPCPTVRNDIVTPRLVYLWGK